MGHAALVVGVGGTDTFGYGMVNCEFSASIVVNQASRSGYNQVKIQGDPHMKTIYLLFISLIALIPDPVSAAGNGAAVVDANGQAAQYLNFNVERVVVDISGLTSSATTLAGSVDRLAGAIGQLSAGDADLTDEDKQTLLAAVKSVDQAAAALSELARQLPGSADRLGERLPQILDAAQQPLAELGNGLEYARDSIYTITEALPQATDNAKRLEIGRAHV